MNNVHGCMKQNLIKYETKEFVNHSHVHDRNILLLLLFLHSTLQKEH